MSRTDTKTLYAIRAFRSGASIFGAAEAWVKDQRQVETFPTMEKAKAQAERYNSGLSTGNVRYVAAEYDPFAF